MLSRWMIFILKVMPLFVYYYPPNSILEAHFIYDRMLYNNYLNYNSEVCVCLSVCASFIRKRLMLMI